MKKLFLCLSIILFSAATAFCQEPDSSALTLMNKVQLSKVYLEQVNRVVKKMPLTAFDSAMSDVPQSPYVKKKINAVAKRIDAYNTTLLEQYEDIIPYADKKDLVKAILYLRGL